MKKTNTTTTATVNTACKLSATEYFARKRAGEVAPGTGTRTRKPGAPLDKVDYFAHKRRGEIAPGTSPANKPGRKPVNGANKPASKPEAVQPENTTKAPEKPANKRKTAAELNASKPNTETKKPGIRETARENMASFREQLPLYVFGKKNEYKETRGIIDYNDTMHGLYRLQATINGKLKTVCRIKAQRDIYALVREEVAQEMGFTEAPDGKTASPEQYALINYNLPAGIHVSYSDIPAFIEKLYSVFEEE